MFRGNSRLGIGLGLYLLSFGIRSLYAVDLAPVMYTRDQPGTRMALRYDDTAVGMLAGDGLLFPRQVDRSRTGLLARPPGYGFFLRLIYGSLGRSFFTVQFVQNLINSAGPVLLFVLATRLVNRPVGILAGVLAASSPHLGYTSNLIGADALSALPLLGALLVLTATPEELPSFGQAALAGLLVGLPAWLRPNLVLMGPFLLLCLLPAFRDPRRAAPRLATMAVVAALTIAPITVRNYVIFGEFVPISANGGLTLWEGIATAGGEAFGAHATDRRVAREEAIRYGKPAYAEWWAEPDGIWRDHDRLRRSFEVIRQRPFWYLRAMLGRAWALVSYHASDAPFVAVSEGKAAPRPPAESEDEDASGSLRVFEGAAADALPPRIPDRVTLWPGNVLTFARRPVRALQHIAALTTLPLIFAGIVLVARKNWRRTLFLGVIPAYYLVFEPPFTYLWRVATPMHYALFAFAAAAWVALGNLALHRKAAA